MEKRLSSGTLITIGVSLTVVAGIMTGTTSSAVASAIIKIICVVSACITCLGLWRTLEEARVTANDAVRIALALVGDGVRNAGIILMRAVWWVWGQLYGALYHLISPWAEACAERAAKYLEKHPRLQAAFDLLMMLLVFVALTLTFPFYLYRRLKMEEVQRRKEDYELHRHI